MFFEFKFEKIRFFLIFFGLKIGFVYCWIVIFENKFEGLVFKRFKEEIWYGFN